MSARITWSPTGDALLVHRDGRATVHRAMPPHDVTLTIAEATFDARWRDDGITTVAGEAWQFRDRDGKIREVVELAKRFSPPFDDAPISAASIAGEAERVAVMRFRVTAYNIRGNTIWREQDTSGEQRGFTLADDGAHVAIGYVTAPIRGRGWVVYDIDKDRAIDRAYVRMPWTAQLAGDAVFAFDRRGKRMVRAWPEAEPDGGAIRLDRGEDYPRPRPGGARAVTLDDRGVIAVYAYNTSLRVDYLDPTTKGGTPIEVASTMTIDAELPDVAALAVSPDRRWIACLSATGAIEVLPVP